MLETEYKFLVNSQLFLAYNVEKDKLQHYICKNPEPYLHYFDDGTSKHFIDL